MTLDTFQRLTQGFRKDRKRSKSTDRICPVCVEANLRWSEHDGSFSAFNSPLGVTCPSCGWQDTMEQGAAVGFSFSARVGAQDWRPT